jgi:hypothetical protein
VKATEALRQIKKAEVRAKVAALPEGQFRVIYADPPPGPPGARQDAISRWVARLSPGPGSAFHGHPMVLWRRVWVGIVLLAAKPFPGAAGGCCRRYWRLSPPIPAAPCKPLAGATVTSRPARLSTLWTGGGVAPPPGTAGGRI